MDTKTKAREFSEYFVKSTRINGNEFVKLKDDAPVELSDFIRTVHLVGFNSLPNDWIYEKIKDAFDMYDEYSSVEDFIYSEAGLDDYNFALYEWAGNGFAHEVINEVMEDYHYPDFYTLIRDGQLRALTYIKTVVADFVGERFYTYK